MTSSAFQIDIPVDLAARYGKCLLLHLTFSVDGILFSVILRMKPLIILFRDELNSWPCLFLSVVFGADGGVGAGPALTFTNSLDQDCFPCESAYCIEQALCMPGYAG